MLNRFASVVPANVLQACVANRWVAALLAALVLSPGFAQAQDGGSEPALAGLNEVKVAYDLKQGDPAALLGILNAIDDSRQSMIDNGVKPSIVLAFRGPASKLVQSDLTALPEEQREGAARVAEKIAQFRTAEGISGMEQCGLTVQALGLEPQDTIAGVQVVENSWTTLAAYQAKGYSYVAP